MGDRGLPTLAPVCRRFTVKWEWLRPADRETRHYKIKAESFCLWLLEIAMGWGKEQECVRVEYGKRSNILYDQFSGRRSRPQQELALVSATTIKLRWIRRLYIGDEDVVENARRLDTRMWYLGRSFILMTCRGNVHSLSMHLRTPCWSYRSALSNSDNLFAGF